MASSTMTLLDAFARGGVMLYYALVAGLVFGVIGAWPASSAIVQPTVAVTGSCTSGGCSGGHDFSTEPSSSSVPVNSVGLIPLDPTNGECVLNDDGDGCIKSACEMTRDLKLKNTSSVYTLTIRKRINGVLDGAGPSFLPPNGETGILIAAGAEIDCGGSLSIEVSVTYPQTGVVVKTYEFSCSSCDYSAPPI